MKKSQPPASIFSEMPASEDAKQSTGEAEKQIAKTATAIPTKKQETAIRITDFKELVDKDVFEWLRKNPKNHFAQHIILAHTSELNAEGVRKITNLPDLKVLPALKSREALMAFAEYKKHLNKFKNIITEQLSPKHLASKIRAVTTHEILRNEISKKIAEYEKSRETYVEDREALVDISKTLDSKVIKERVQAATQLSALADKHHVTYEKPLTLATMPELLSQLEDVVDAKEAPIIEKQKKLQQFGELPASVINALFDPTSPLLPDNATFFDTKYNASGKEHSKDNLVSTMAQLCLSEGNAADWIGALEARSHLLTRAFVSSINRPDSLAKYLLDGEVFEPENNKQKTKLLSRFIHVAYSAETPEETLNILTESMGIEEDDAQKFGSRFMDFFKIFARGDSEYSRTSLSYATLLSPPDILMLMATIERVREYQANLKVTHSEDFANNNASDMHRLDVVAKTLNEKSDLTAPQILKVVKGYAGLLAVTDEAAQLAKETPTNELIYIDRSDSPELREKKQKIIDLVENRLATAKNRANKTQAKKIEIPKEVKNDEAAEVIALPVNEESEIKNHVYEPEKMPNQPPIEVAEDRPIEASSRDFIIPEFNAGDIVKTMREASGMSIEELQKQAIPGGKDTIKKIENGTHKLNFSSITAIGRILKLPLEGNGLMHAAALIASDIQSNTNRKKWTEKASIQVQQRIDELHSKLELQLEEIKANKAAEVAQAKNPRAPDKVIAAFNAGAFVKALRESRGKTQESLQKAAFTVDTGTLKRIEDGEIKLDFPSITAIADALNLSPLQRNILIAASNIVTKIDNNSTPVNIWTYEEKNEIAAKIDELNDRLQSQLPNKKKPFTPPHETPSSNTSIAESIPNVNSRYYMDR